MLEVNALDAGIFIFYVAAVLIIGFVVGRREQKQAMGYFLAGRTLPWFAIGLSMVATSISTEQFIGAGAKSYEVGMAVLHWEWGVLPSFTLLAFIFLPIYFRQKIYTIPEYLERRFSSFAAPAISLPSHARVPLKSKTRCSSVSVVLPGMVTSTKGFRSTGLSCRER